MEEASLIKMCANVGQKCMSSQELCSIFIFFEDMFLFTIQLSTLCVVF